MSTAQIIICEKTPRWAAAWRRTCRRQRVVLSPGTLQQARSLVQCERLLSESPASLVAIEVLPVNVLTIAKTLSRWSRTFPTARVVLLADPSLESCELLLRETGAVAVVNSPFAMRTLLGIWRRHVSFALATKKKNQDKTPFLASGTQ